MKCKHLLLIYILCLFFSHVSAQTPEADSSWFVNHYWKMEKYITMRDGARLFTSIYIPNDSAVKHPILLQRTPYGCFPYGEHNFMNAWTNYFFQYLREGYILVFQDVRGRWMSEGHFEDVRPFIINKKPGDIDETTDAFDGVDWMVKNIPGNNGNVGVIGTSYPGFYAAMAAASGHPAIKAVSPQAPVTNWFIGDDFHHNGAFLYMDAFDFFVAGGFGRPHPKPVDSESAMKDIYYSKDCYKFYLQEGADKNLLKYAGDSIAFFQEMYRHPDYDAWWQKRNATHSQYHIKPAVLIVGGLFDAEDGYGAWNLYRAISRQSPATSLRLVMGPWYHTQWGTDEGTHLGNIDFGSNTSVTYQHEIEIPFFNQYLKNKTDSETTGATIFFTGENKWHSFKSWPGANVKPTKFFLLNNNRLSDYNNQAFPSFDEYLSDPAHPVPYTQDVHFNRTREYMTDDQRFASRRPDVLFYQSPELKEDLTIGGPVTADLRCSISTTDADFVVKLIDVFPDTLSYTRVDIYSVVHTEKTYPMGGYQMLVRGDIFRGKYRAGFEKPVPFKPGKIETIRFTMPDVAHTFKKGHRLMIQIQSSWFPLADRNPQIFTDIYTCDDSAFRKSTIRIYHDTQNPSAIILPVIAGKLP